MRYQRLGRDGPIVSRIAYGNSLTAGQQCTDDTATACVRAAFDAGITTFDTADIYADGRAEALLGTALRQFRRDDVVICTKVGRRAGLSGAEIRAGIDGSLRRLGVDHVDLYQAHRYDDETPIEETMAAFAEVVRAGKARWIGVSEWSSAQLRAAGFPLVSNQPQYSLLWRVIEADVLPTGVELGLGHLVWSPLAGGVLTGKYRPGHAPPTRSRFTATEHGAATLRRWGFLDDDVLAAVHELKPVAAQAGLSLPQLALAWVLGTAGITTAIIGASRPEQIQSNVVAAEVELGAEVRAEIDRIVGPVARWAA